MDVASTSDSESGEDIVKVIEQNKRVIQKVMKMVRILVIITVVD